MAGLIGHTHQLRQLRPPAFLPPVTLLIGPSGIGKRLLAEVVAYQHKYDEDDIFIGGEPLLVDGTADLLAFAQRASARGRLAIASLDGASVAVQSVLLKTLEEPPRGMKFLLTASQPPLPTIVSRSQIVRCGPLSAEDVERVLQRKGVPPKAARTAALMSGGSPGMAMTFSQAAMDGALAMVTAALKAATSRNPGQLIALFKSWEQVHHVLLSQWAVEAVTFRWRVFSADTAPGIGRGQAEYALTMLTSLQGARPRIVDRAVLEMLAVRKVS